MASTIQQISKALDGKVCATNLKDLLKNYVVRDEMMLLEQHKTANFESKQKNQNAGYSEDGVDHSDKFYELDQKIEEYCNSIVEQFDKVASKDDIYALKAEIQIKPSTQQLHELLEEKASKQFVTNIANQKSSKDELNLLLEDTVKFLKSEISKVHAEVSVKADWEQVDKMCRQFNAMKEEYETLL